MTDNVHSHSMTIKRSVDEAYLVAERDGFALLDIAIDEDRLKNTLMMTAAGPLSVLRAEYATITMPVALSA